MDFKLTPDTSVDDVIEHILVLLNTNFRGGCLSVPDFCRRDDDDYGYDVRIEKLVRSKMYNYGVAEPCRGSGQPETSVELTTKGVEVYDSGGWKKHLLQLTKEKQNQDAALLAEQRRQEEAHQATISSAHATTDAAKSARRSVAVAWFSGIIALFAFLLSLYQWISTKQTESDLIELRSKVKAIDSLMRDQLPAQKPKEVQIETKRAQ